MSTAPKRTTPERDTPPRRNRDHEHIGALLYDEPQKEVLGGE